MYDSYTMKIVLMKNESSDFLYFIWLKKFMKIVIYDFSNYGKRIMKNIFMTIILWFFTLH